MDLLPCRVISDKVTISSQLDLLPLPCYIWRGDSLLDLLPCHAVSGEVTTLFQPAGSRSEENES